MPGSKIQDEGEIIRWIREGRTYRWMAEEYLRKYRLAVFPSMFSNFRQRRGLERRITRDDDLIPWDVDRQHRWQYQVMMLRKEARRRAGQPLTAADLKGLTAWREGLRTRNEVVDYSPEDGFRLVPRRPGIDLDLICEPEFKSTQRRSRG